MKINKPILIAAAIVAALVVSIGTVVLLRYINDRNNSTSVQPDDTDTSPGKAETIEAEANELLFSDPAKAQEKFSEAETLYTEDGDDGKAAEARRNAASAEAILNSMKAEEERSKGGVTHEAAGPTE